MIEVHATPKGNTRLASDRDSSNELYYTAAYLTQTQRSDIRMHAAHVQGTSPSYAHPERHTYDSFMFLTTYSRGVHWYVSTVLRAVAPDSTECE